MPWDPSAWNPDSQPRPDRQQEPGTTYSLPLVRQEGIAVNGEAGGGNAEVFPIGQGLPQLARHRSGPVVQDVTLSLVLVWRAGIPSQIRHTASLGSELPSTAHPTLPSTAGIVSQGSLTPPTG